MQPKLILLFLAFPMILNAQTSVKGIVTEQNSGNKPVSSVQIKALGTNPETSDNNGFFQLIFTSKKPGDRIFVTEISKKGYEIVNKDKLNNWLIPGDESDQTKIVMCPEGLIAENTAKYYNISLEGITSGYKKKIKELQEKLDKALIDSKSYGTEAKILSEQYETQQRYIEELAEKFAHENFDDCSKIQQQAFIAFKEGNIEEAIRILETVNSAKEIEKAREQKGRGQNLVNKGKEMQDQADSIIQNNIEKLLFQADLYAANFRFNDAERTYEEAVKADTTNFSNTFHFACFLKHQLEYDKAQQWCKVALPLATNEYDLVDVINNLALIQRLNNQFDDAEKNFNKAKQILSKLVTENPDQYLPDMASLLSNIADLQRKENRLLEARQNYIKALGLYSSNSQNLKGDYLSNYLTVLNNYSLLELIQNNFKTADSCYMVAYNVIQAVAKTDSLSYKKELSFWLHNYASFHDKQDHFAEAEKYFLEAVKVRRSLADNNPKAYNFDVAQTLNNLGVLYYQNNHFEKAETCFAEALDIDKELYERNHQVFANDLITMLNNVSTFYTELNEYKKSEQSFSEALTICRAMCHENPEVYNPSLATLLGNRANLKYYSGNFAAADSNYTEALSIHRNLALNNPQMYDGDVALSLNNLASLYHEMNWDEKSENFYKEALEIRRKLAITNPEVYESDVAITLNNLSSLYFDLGRYDQSELTSEEAIEIYRKLATSNPQKYNPDLARSLNNMGNLQDMTKQTEKAILSYNNALVIRKELALKNPQFYNSDYARTLYDMAWCQYKTDLKGAIQHANEAIGIYEDLVKKEQCNPDYLAYNYNRMVRYQIMEKNFDSAYEYARKTKEINNTIKAFNKNLAHSLLFLGKYDEALTYYQELKSDESLRKIILTDLDDFEKAGINNPDIEKIRTLLTN
jgi:tetratricopeptide (TPR) repeat protein